MLIKKWVAMLFAAMFFIMPGLWATGGWEYCVALGAESVGNKVQPGVWVYLEYITDDDFPARLHEFVLGNDNHFEWMVGYYYSEWDYYLIGTYEIADDIMKIRLTSYESFEYDDDIDDELADGRKMDIDLMYELAVRLDVDKLVIKSSDNNSAITQFYTSENNMIFVKDSLFWDDEGYTPIYIENFFKSVRRKN